MNIMDFLSPVCRRKKTLFIFILFYFFLVFGLFLLIPNVEKATVYFTIKDPSIETNIPMDPPESASKVAEAIAGWAKDPGFRNQIQEQAGIQIPNFKRKISARKQNRINVFWTLKFYSDESQYSEVITNALVDTLNKNFEDINKNNGYPIYISTPRIAYDTQSFPQSWKAVGALFLALILGVLALYMMETFRGKISFLKQIKNIYPTSSLLRLPAHIGRHDESVLEQYILKFKSPRLVGTFPSAEKYFSVASSDSVDKTNDTPILLVRLGDTSVYELENLHAIFGEKVGIVVFEK